MAPSNLTLEPTTNAACDTEKRLNSPFFLRSSQLTLGGFVGGGYGDSKHIDTIWPLLFCLTYAVVFDEEKLLLILLEWNNDSIISYHGVWIVDTHFFQLHIWIIISRSYIFFVDIVVVL